MAIEKAQFFGDEFVYVWVRDDFVKVCGVHTSHEWSISCNDFIECIKCGEIKKD